jgi:CheY-like chemotaxis protein
MSDNFFINANENAIVRFIAPSARILIVDDINTNLKVAEGLMLPYKMQLDLCMSGADAIEAVKNNRYDLVFMDHMMPEMDGIEANKIIRDLKYDLPIIALTANAVSGTKEMFFFFFFNDFLSKPIDTIKLNVILEKWLSNKKQEKPSEDMNVLEAGKGDLNLAIRGVDVKKGVAMMGGNAEHYMQTISIFYKDCLQKFNEIESCLEAHDYNLYATYVHALKSTTASIGAADLSEKAKLLEAAGKREDSEFIKQHNPGFIVKLKELASDINDALSLSKENKQEVPVDIDVLRSELNKLKEALVALNPSAINSTTSYLQEFTKSEKFGASLEAILQNTLIGEYDEAVAIIDKLVASV